MTQQIDLQNLKSSEYITERIYENEFVEPVKFLPVRFRTDIMRNPVPNSTEFYSE